MKKKKPCVEPRMIKELLEGKEIRATTHRVVIAQYILCEADHPDAEEVRIWAEKKLPSVSKGTIYNTLKELVNAGLISEFRFPHSTKTIYDCNTQHHYHLLDDEDGSLIDIDPSPVSIKSEIEKDYKIEKIDLLFRARKKKD